MMEKRKLSIPKLLTAGVGRERRVRGEGLLTEKGALGKGTNISTQFSNWNSASCSFFFFLPPPLSALPLSSRLPRCWAFLSAQASPDIRTLMLKRIHVLWRSWLGRGKRACSDLGSHGPKLGINPYSVTSCLEHPGFVRRYTFLYLWVGSDYTDPTEG